MFYIDSTTRTQGFQPPEGNLAKKTKLDALDNNGTAKPLVPLLRSTYAADKAAYDAQDVMWALHDNPIV